MTTSRSGECSKDCVNSIFYWPHAKPDCGATIFSKEQDAHAGGSGCGCVASVTCGYLMRLMEQKDVRRLLVVGSGALLSTTSQQQGESIPGIAYAACLEGEG